MIVIYTDGACKNNPGVGGWGFYAQIPGGYIIEHYGGDAYTTNNAMELTAAIKALKYCYDTHIDHTIAIYTDSNYVKNGITDWISGWIRRGWRTSYGKPVKNKELWIDLHKLNNSLEVEWHWVKGHSSDPGNDKADELANKGVANVLATR